MTGVVENPSGHDLEALRRRAWKAFAAASAPLKTIETWRRVDFNAWGLDRLTEADLPAPPVQDGASISLGDASGVFRHETGTAVHAALDPALAKKGVVLSTLEAALKVRPALVEAWLKLGSACADFRKLEAANLAGFPGGVFLHVPKGVRVDKPFDLAFLQRPGGRWSFPRVLVILEPGAEATVVEEHAGSGGPSGGKSSSAAFSTLVIGADAKARYFYNQALPPDTAHFWHHQVELGSGALLRHYSVLLGGAVHKSEVVAKLSGKGARSELYGIVFGNGRQVFDPHTAQWHGAPRTESDLLYKVAMRERARSIYTGLIRVEREAVGSDAFQQNNNIILSEGARADTTPVLEILTDEVRCKHGATMGPLSQDELFYLGCRGLDPKEAAKMLVMGFFEPVLKDLPLERLKDRLPAEIEERLAS